MSTLWMAYWLALTGLWIVFWYEIVKSKPLLYALYMYMLYGAITAIEIKMRKL